MLNHARHPAAVAAALACVLFSANFLPVSPPEDSLVVRVAVRARSWLESRSLISARPKAQRVVPGSAVAFGYQYVRVEGDRAHPIDFEEHSWDTLSRLVESGAHIGRVAYVREVRRSGLWAPWFERGETINVRVTLPAGEKLVTGEPLRSSMLGAAADSIGKQGAPMGSPRVRVLAEDIAKGGALRRRVLWGRVLWNLATLVSAAVLIHGLVTQPKWWARRRLLREGSCPKCGYDLIAINHAEGVRTCPECGTRTHLELSHEGASHAPGPSLPGRR